MWRVEQCSNEPYPRCAHTCETIGDYMYLFGGWTDDNQMLNDLYRFNIDRWEWEVLIPHTSNNNNNNNSNNEGSNQNNSNNGQGVKDEIIARNGHTLTAYGKSLVLFGGGSFQGFLNDVALYDTETKKWNIIRNVKGTPPSGRSKHSATLIGNNRLYVFGGGDGVRLHNDLSYLDLETMEWNTVTTQGPQPSPRWGHSMVSHGNGTKLAVFGGHSGSKRLNDLYIFDTVTNQWEQPKIDPSSEMPQPRAGHSAQVINNDFMVVFGGGDGHILHDCMGLDLHSWRWWKISNVLSMGRCAHSCSILKNNIVIFGGGNGLQCIKKMLVFENIDTIVQSWRTKTTISSLSNISNTLNANIKLQQQLQQLQQNKPLNNNTNNNNNNNNNNTIIHQQHQTEKPTPKKLSKSNVNETLLSNTLESLVKKNNELQQQLLQQQQLQQKQQQIEQQQQQQQREKEQFTIKRNQHIVDNMEKLKTSCLTNNERRDIKFFLTNIGMAKYVNRFIEEEIDTTVLHMLTELHLKQLGVSLLGERLTIIKGIRESTLYLFKGLPSMMGDLDPNVSPNWTN